jgi:hypothetical protein
MFVWIFVEPLAVLVLHRTYRTQSALYSRRSTRTRLIMTLCVRKESIQAY